MCTNIFFFLLQDIEDLENKPVNTISYTVNSENGCVTLSEAHFAELQRTIQTLKAQLEQRELACFLAKQVSRCVHCIVYNIFFFLSCQIYSHKEIQVNTLI